MENNTYTAWALYTGPNQPTPLWENSRWIAGQWDGKKGEDGQSKKDIIKQDIDARINCLIKSFKNCREKITNRGVTVTNYFVVPEFYFHCKYGPYPRIKISRNNLPYEYICITLHDRIKNIVFKDLEAGQTENWIICAGSVLTCNIPNIEKFLNTKRVKTRLDTLNKKIPHLPALYNKYVTTNHSNERRKQRIILRHIKARSYMKTPVTLSDPEKEINALMDEFRADPLCVVRNRGMLYKAVFSGKSETHVQYWGYEKQNESTVDLTMGKIVSKDKTCKLEHGGMITEWMANYTSISIINGDKNTKMTPMAARITINDTSLNEKKLEIGVEICLDHRLKRLRRTLEMTKENGATEDNPPINLQLVPSGGMQILDYSVAAGALGAIFNCDGCDPILDRYDSEGKPVIPDSGEFKGITCGVYASSAQNMVKIPGEDNNGHEYCYYSHSQLSFRYGNEELDGYNNALGTSNKKGQTYDPETKKNESLDVYSPPQIVDIEVKDSGKDSLFVAGLGKLHIYQVKLR